MLLYRISAVRSLPYPWLLQALYIDTTRPGSVKDVLPFGFFPSGARPCPTLPVSFKSMCQSAVSPPGFLSVKPKIAPPFFIASFRSASSERAEERASNAAEDGKASTPKISLENIVEDGFGVKLSGSRCIGILHTILERHCGSFDSSDGDWTRLTIW